MLNRQIIVDRREAVMGVAERLFSAERAATAAVREAAQLIDFIPAAQERGRFSPDTGQDAMARAASSLMAMVSARGDMVAAHKALAEDAVRNRLDPRMFGPWEECAQAAPAPLSVVAA
jgi:hypothetical protein